ncbi:MAG: hypothetical protein KF799_06805 [Bdellovibrionales bacterium]|nr:hypothetical protein [Bdellovibrionales bacterium]
MKAILVISAFLASTVASAAQFKTVKESSNANRSEIEISYPELFSNSVPAYATINADIAKNVRNGCGEPEADQPGFYYEAEARVVALNKNYVGIGVSGNDYCGGAHPNSWSYYLTYDSQSGKSLNIEREFGFTDYDAPDYDSDMNDALRTKLAGILVNHIPPEDQGEEGCFPGTRQEKIEALLTFYPVVHGLAKDKTIVLGIQPPHVAAACRFEIRVKLQDVKSMLPESSYLNEWLK